MVRIYRNDVSPITKEKQSLSHTGKRHSEETKEKISKAMVKYWGELPLKPVDGGAAPKEKDSSITYEY